MAPRGELPTTSFAVLGLLSYGPLSGYALASLAEQSIGNFWTIAKSQVYRELARLEELGYVEGTDVRQEKLPDKRMYELTNEGRSSLIEWLNNPSPDKEGTRMRSTFLLKVFFGNLMEPEQLLDMIRTHRDQAEQALERFDLILDQLSRDPGAVYMLTTAKLGKRVTEATAEWADEAVKSLSRRRTPSKRRSQPRKSGRKR